MEREAEALMIENLSKKYEDPYSACIELSFEPLLFCIGRIS